MQHILDNKQARGAFGESQLADIVRDGLPDAAYEFQHTLSNGKRADCLIRLPNPPGPVVIDSKFPLEGYQKLRAAENDADMRAALNQLKSDTLKHAQDIADKYILPGETADAALMFLPSESVFSELHLRLPDLIDKIRNLRVYPVSPNTMSLTLNTVRAIMRDVKMREQAGLIKEVRTLLTDVARLSERVGQLRRHFELTEKDIEQIEVSNRKISGRGEKITDMELQDKPPAAGQRPRHRLIHFIYNFSVFVPSPRYMAAVNSCHQKCYCKEFDMLAASETRSFNACLPRSALAVCLVLATMTMNRPDIGTRAQDSEIEAAQRAAANALAAAQTANAAEAGSHAGIDAAEAALRSAVAANKAARDANRRRAKPCHRKCVRS